VSVAKIISVEAVPFDTPLHNPFVTSQGVATSARAVKVTITLSDGTQGIGESVPVKYVTGETIESVLDAVSLATASLVGLQTQNYRECAIAIAAAAPGSPSARCGLEMAVLDAYCAANGVTLHSLLGAAVASMDTDVTLPIVPNAGELAAAAWELGIRVFKIKVGDSDRNADWNRIADIRAAAPEARLRIDANQAFSPGEAIEFIHRLTNSGAVVELLEQPVASTDFDGMHAVALASPVPVFADESCRTPQDALKLVTATAVQGLNLKINKNGLFGVLDIIPIARASGRKLMLGCMLETRRSIAVSAAIACGTGAFDHIDLDSHLLLNEALAEGADGFVQVGPTITPGTNSKP
jgi:L-Ala-D/L-Glu epimerase